ncbi:MAG: pro-sigmaK processing inhibitor BofA family protein [bacterium]|nr:pro-sigmaK processing inhibitor BofA family protein [bacterium]
MITRFVKRIIFSILLLYAFDLIMHGFNIIVPINYFNIIVIILLGFPGLIALALAFFFFI